VNRGVSLSVVLAMMGCSGRVAQPIVVDREALVGSREERIEEVVEEDEAWEPASLAAPSELHGLIAVQPGDLMTATSRSSPSIVAGPGAEAVTRSLRDEGRVRLVTYPEGDEVPFEWPSTSEPEPESLTEPESVTEPATATESETATDIEPEHRAHLARRSGRGGSLLQHRSCTTSSPSRSRAHQAGGFARTPAGS
jgi:hypothetical protein